MAGLLVIPAMNPIDHLLRAAPLLMLAGCFSDRQEHAAPKPTPVVVPAVNEAEMVRVLVTREALTKIVVEEMKIKVKKTDRVDAVIDSLGMSVYYVKGAGWGPTSWAIPINDGAVIVILSPSSERV